MPFNASPSAALTAPRRGRRPSVPPGKSLIPDPTYKTRIIVGKSGVEMGHFGLPRPILSARRRHDKRRRPAKTPLFSDINKPWMGIPGAPGAAVLATTAGQAALERRLFVLDLGQVADEIDDGAAEFCRADFHETGDQCQPVGSSQEFRDMGERRRIRDVRFRARDAGSAFKEKLHRHLKDCRNMLKAACADAVRTLFIFLHLLERYAKRLGKIPESERCPPPRLTHNPLR